MCDLNKMLVTCTLGDFAEAIAQVLLKQPTTPETKRNCVKGLKGIQTIFCCTEWRARKIKRSGVIDDAITTLGARDFIVDVEKALQLYNNSI